MLKKFFAYCWRNLIVRSLLLMAVISTLLLVGVLYWIDSYTLHNEGVIVPSLKSMQVDDAKALLTERGLRARVIDSIYTNEVQPGAIIEQIPAPDMVVKDSRIVFLTINSVQRQMVSLPNVKDLSQRAAESHLTRVGLKIEKVKEVKSEYRGLVMGVEYNGKHLTSGDRLPIHAAVTLLVGKGRENDGDSLSIVDEVSPESPTILNLIE